MFVGLYVCVVVDVYFIWVCLEFVVKGWVLVWLFFGVCGVLFFW